MSPKIGGRLRSHAQVMQIAKLIHDTRDRLGRKLRKHIAKAQARLRPVVLKNAGFCPICERNTTFISRDPWLRDHYKCVRCGSIPRERALMLVIQQRFPNWRELTIHESSPGNRGSSKRFAAECRAYIPTHFFPGNPPGSMVNEYRCENLEELSFGDATVDLHVTQDVFEHVLRPARAFAEVARTLKPGGAHIFTTPLVRKEKPSAKRIEVGANGAIEHLQPPRIPWQPDRFERLARHDRLGLRHSRAHCRGVRARHRDHSHGRLDQRHQG